MQLELLQCLAQAVYRAMLT